MYKYIYSYVSNDIGIAKFLNIFIKYIFNYKITFVFADLFHANCYHLIRKTVLLYLLAIK